MLPTATSSQADEGAREVKAFHSLVSAKVFNFLRLTRLANLAKLLILSNTTKWQSHRLETPEIYVGQQGMLTFLAWMLKAYWRLVKKGELV